MTIENFYLHLGNHICSLPGLPACFPICCLYTLQSYRHNLQTYVLTGAQLHQQPVICNNTVKKKSSSRLQKFLVFG